MEKREKKVLQTIICMGLLCIILSGYFLVRRHIDKQIIPIQDDFSWVYQVDSVEIREDEFLLRGFAFELGKDALGGNYDIILQDLETEENHILEMEYFERSDVNDYFLCEYDYSKSGFEAKVENKEIDLQGKGYEVLLRKSSRSAYRTGVYLLDKKLVYANPQEFVPLQVAGTELEEIVVNGVLRVYRPDYGMYVYQYNGELYWIAERSYQFIDNNTCVQYQMNTTQIDRLPEYRVLNGWDWDNMEFAFADYELLNYDTGIYRVAKHPLPKTYSVTQIWTGNYIDGWIWQQDFRPWYDFK